MLTLGEVQFWGIRSTYPKKLKRKALGSFCAPQPCHGAVTIDSVCWAETVSPTYFQKMQ